MNNVYLTIFSYLASACSRQIAAAIPRHHKAAHGLAHAAASEVEAICLAGEDRISG